MARKKIPPPETKYVARYIAGKYEVWPDDYAGWKQQCARTEERLVSAGGELAKATAPGPIRRFFSTLRAGFTSPPFLAFAVGVGLMTSLVGTIHLFIYGYTKYGFSAVTVLVLIGAYVAGRDNR